MNGLGQRTGLATDFDLGIGRTGNPGSTVWHYDYLGRRISKTVGTATTCFIHDNTGEGPEPGWTTRQGCPKGGAARRGGDVNWNLIAEYAGATPSVSRTHTWGLDLSGTLQGAGGVGGSLAVTIGSATYHPTYDGNGNGSEYPDSNGIVKAHYEYDPFGKLVVVTGDQEVEDDQGNVAAHIPSVDFAHCFSTKYLDTETGLYGYGFMYMDTRTGRWLSRDPVGERGGVNLYAFVGNNGIDRSDYLGLSKLRIWCEVPQKIQLGECGTFSWFIEWNVKPASGKDGGIVLQEYKAKGVVQPTRWCCLINTTGKLGG